MTGAAGEDTEQHHGNSLASRRDWQELESGRSMEEQALAAAAAPPAPAAARAGRMHASIRRMRAPASTPTRGLLWSAIMPKNIGIPCVQHSYARCFLWACKLLTGTDGQPRILDAAVLVALPCTRA